MRIIQAILVSAFVQIISISYGQKFSIFQSVIIFFGYLIADKLYDIYELLKNKKP